MRVAVPIAAGFEDSEFSVLRDRLSAAGHHLVLLGARADEKVTGRMGIVSAVIDAAAQHLDPDDYDAMFISGGQAPDALRLHRAAGQARQRQQCFAMSVRVRARPRRA